MAEASIVRDSFLGGEWAKEAQGKFSDPRYKTAMALCLNAIPAEEESCGRRPGWAEMGITRRAKNGIIRSFAANGNGAIWHPELTWDGSNSWLRLWVDSSDGLGKALYYESTASIASISTATPAVLQTTAAQTWSTGDTVQIFLDPILLGDPESGLHGQQFTITKVDTTHFSLAWASDGSDVDGTSFAAVAFGASQVNKVWEVEGPYTSLNNVRTARLVQADNLVFFFQSSTTPWYLAGETDGTKPLGVAFTFADALFKLADGPYLDPVPGGSRENCKIINVTSISGNDYDVVVDNTDGGPDFFFASSDVGRCFRFLGTCASFAYGGGGYSVGAVVEFNGAFYRNTVLGTTTAPGQPVTIAGVVTFPWDPFSDHPEQWGYGYISAYTSTTEVTVTVLDPSISRTVGLGVIFETPSIWQIGAYGGTQQPSTGCYQEGRLFIFGQGIDGVNRFDASKPNWTAKFAAGVVNTDHLINQSLFSPSDIYGVVADDNAISYTLNSGENNAVNWAVPDRQGVIIGAATAEFLIQASSNNDPMTPTSVQAHPVSYHKSLDTPPVRVGSALIFPHARANRVFEYLADSFSGKFIAKTLNDKARHMPTAGSGFKELVYVEDPTPIVWGILNNGQLVGCTYRRESNFASEPPKFNAWHKHEHGGGRALQSLAYTALDSASRESIIAITLDSVSQCRVEVMMAPLPETGDLTQAWYLDGARPLRGFGGPGTGTPNLLAMLHFNGDDTEGSPQLDAITSTDGVTWTQNTAPAGQWLDLAWGNGMFAGLGIKQSDNSPRIVTSPDGATWTEQTVNNSLFLTFPGQIAFGNGVFVATTRQGVVRSTDGVTWTEVAYPGTSRPGTPFITFGGGVFVIIFPYAGGDPGFVLRSHDGLTWTTVSLPSAQQLDYRGITHGKGLFVAVAINTANQNILTSADGITWALRSQPGSGTNRWQEVAYGHGTFAAPGTSTAGMMSPDGVTWTATTLDTVPAGCSVDHISFGFGEPGNTPLFIITLPNSTRTSQSYIMTSPNGKDWTTRSLGSGNNGAFTRAVFGG